MNTLTGPAEGRTAFRPAIDIAAEKLPFALDAEVAQMSVDVVAEAMVALDKRDRAGATRQGFQADDPGAGEHVDERPIRDGIAQDAEKRFAHSLRRRPQAGMDRDIQFAAAKTAGDDADLRFFHDGVINHRCTRMNTDKAILICHPCASVANSIFCKGSRSGP